MKLISFASSPGAGGGGEGKAYKQNLLSDKQRISQHLFGFRKGNHFCYYHKTNILEVLPVFSQLLKALPKMVLVRNNTHTE